MPPSVDSHMSQEPLTDRRPSPYTLSPRQVYESAESPSSSTAFLHHYPNHYPSSPNPPPVSFRRSVGSSSSLLNPKPTSSLSYASLPASNTNSVSSKYAWSPDPSQWGTAINDKEADDDFHDPKDAERSSSIFHWRGFINLGFLVVLMVGLISLFAVYPIISYYARQRPRTLGGYNLGGTNGSGQVPEIVGRFSLIDVDTPKSVREVTSIMDGKTKMQLVFSDEFNTDGRTFYPGDDPYWEAADLHYWSTNNLEWYDPAAITTENGYLKITLDNITTHGLNYRGGLLSSWNKFCFTGGYVEVNVSLPGVPTVRGLWPAIWTLGNLGRPGYGATQEGTWPYTYDACDVGTLKNQTLNGEPYAATVNGDKYHNDVLSYLPGQRLSACTCPEDETHPGPKKADGTWTGRGTPEIDIFEATVGWNATTETFIGEASQSSQWAPFDESYAWDNSTENVQYGVNSSWNSYQGGVYQQAVSALSITNQRCYTGLDDFCFTTYAIEYKSGYDGYVAWLNDGHFAWSMRGAGLKADAAVNISARPVPQEPMFLILNLGISESFGTVDFDKLLFPTWMGVDYVRVYQPADSYNIGCSPPDFPTEAYINRFIDAYTNPNLTIYEEVGGSFPKNRLIDTCGT